MKTITTPKGLTRSGLAFWRKLKASLEETGNLEVSDHHVLLLAAKDFEDHEEARANIRKNGITIETLSDRGHQVTKTNPAAAIVNQAATRLLRHYDRLGLTPASRLRSGRGGSGSIQGYDPIGDLLNK
jgi:P27 family predicted phage terminase small subunit